MVMRRVAQCVAIAAQVDGAAIAVRAVPIAAVATVAVGALKVSLQPPKRWALEQKMGDSPQRLSEFYHPSILALLRTKGKKNRTSSRIYFRRILGRISLYVFL